MRTLSVSCGFLVLLVSCGGPERAPRQPIPGVDVTHAEDANPHDATPAPAAGPFLGGFAEDVASATRRSPGLVAVFPALAPAPQSGGFTVNGLGEYLAEETVVRLEAEGVAVLSGTPLIEAIHGMNRPISSYRSVIDAWNLAERVGAAYVVTGTVRHQVFDLRTRDEALRIDWQCRRLDGNEPVARYRADLTGGALAERLRAFYDQESQWERAAGAERFQPSVEDEAKLLTRALLQDLLEEHSGDLTGKSLLVEPAVIRALSGPRAEMASWAESFHRQYIQTVEAARVSGAEDPEAAAMEAGPVRIAEKEYANFGEALDEYRTRRNRIASTRAGELSSDLAATISEHLKAALGDRVRLLPPEADRQALIAAVSRDAGALRDADSPTEELLESLRRKGVDVLVRTTLRPFLKTYRLRVTLLDARTASESSRSIDFGPFFTQELDQVLEK